MLEIATRVAARNAVEPVTCNTVVAADAPPTRVKASRPARIVLEVFKLVNDHLRLPRPDYRTR